MTNSLEESLKTKKKIIDKELEKYLKITYPEILFESMAYSVFAGGKRIRPLLMLAACEAVGGNIEAALPFACALEFIHTYSLIHDDLPAMDDDDLRRGMPTNHIKFGEATAILAGDGLLNLAYEIMSEHCLKNFSPNNIRAMQIIAQAAGSRGMVAGQAVDITSESKSDSARLMYIIENKTAKLIQAATVAGAVLGNAHEEHISQLSKAGLNLGISFQIRDDILDITSTESELGKPINSDIKNDKLTYVSVHGEEKAKQDFRSFITEAIDIFKQFKENNLLEQIAVSLLN